MSGSFTVTGNSATGLVLHIHPPLDKVCPMGARISRQEEARQPQLKTPRVGTIRHWARKGQVRLATGDKCSVQTEQKITIEQTDDRGAYQGTVLEASAKGITVYPLLHHNMPSGAVIVLDEDPLPQERTPPHKKNKRRAEERHMYDMQHQRSLRGMP